jgi:hypothetical protein
MTRKKTTEEFIKESVVIHENKYNYSKVKYIKNSTKVIIICKEHGEFEQQPNNHLQGKGCNKCVGGVKSTTKEFIEKAKLKHGDIYDYSKVDYVNSKTKVIIICKEHGDFLQSPTDHLSGKNCSKCVGGVKSTTKEFIEKAKLKHGNTYDYSKVEYVNNKTKVIIICKEHGDFLQTPKNHMKGRRCGKCFGSIKLTTETFIEKAKLKHDYTYDYSRVDYINAKNNITIICRNHGEFRQNPNTHLQGSGCNECGVERAIIKQNSNTNDFIKKAKLKHGDTYDYSKVEYVNNKTKVIIICRKHGEFRQNPNTHLQGSGCVLCADNNIQYTTKIFIEKSKLKHGDTYDYSKVDYVNAKTKVKIICKEHGEFEQLPITHMKGCGCNKCGENTTSNKLSMTIKEYINRAKEIHGDTYDYSKVEYVNNKTKVIIICRKHGEFIQEAGSHITGVGCPYCIYKNEADTKLIIEELTGFIFHKTKRIIKKDGRCYELDGYNNKLKIAFEYQGEQHYNYIPFFHRKGKIDLIHQQIRDYIKMKECKRKNIQLIVVPYWIKDKEKFIKQKLQT